MTYLDGTDQNQESGKDDNPLLKSGHGGSDEARVCGGTGVPCIKGFHWVWEELPADLSTDIRIRNFMTETVHRYLSVN